MIAASEKRYLDPSPEDEPLPKRHAIAALGHCPRTAEPGDVRIVVLTEEPPQLTTEWHENGTLIQNDPAEVDNPAETAFSHQSKDSFQEGHRNQDETNLSIQGEALPYQIGVLKDHSREGEKSQGESQRADIMKFRRREKHFLSSEFLDDFLDLLDELEEENF
eukprot:CAMPEP_0183304976 /NCGR_PEP_ID=MMETSP0160_2-20130417/9870_1 /TAXON_ID=2839 ORGANISM="Odontella Sinensis, Strain Grunow 1884" /NCGR_SAMPLE_ID=MMETSP0160_2 /ASSEMBLY_ACC=CAM_ASM_000250 /LENGTH=162 /DNA_ID=CAMNT_0025468105 /DNA_START=136 /DNA_END=624 /DNA_ORIENTATION=-